MNENPLHDPKSFITQVLLNEIADIIKHHVYLSYALIAIGIEFLGKCIDDSINDWNDGSSEKTFNLAIDQLMPKYKPYKLYKFLRCGLAHNLAPQAGLGLSENKNGTSHLSVLVDGTLVLHIEDFFRDFEVACNKVIYGIDNKVYKNSKMYRAFLVLKG